MSKRPRGQADIEAAQSRIGYVFKDKALIIEALTHSSYANENNTLHNERLEFLGDAVVGMIVAEELYIDNGGNEGTLTQIRQNIVSTTALAAAAERAGLDKLMLTGKGFCNNVSSPRQKAGVFEAVAAAVYLDGGWEAVKDFVDNFTAYENTVNYKSLLAEYFQEKKLGDIEYMTLSERGNQHRKLYTVRVRAGEMLSGDHEAHSKQSAQKLAARELCDKIGIN